VISFGARSLRDFNKKKGSIKAALGNNYHATGVPELYVPGSVQLKVTQKPTPLNKRGLANEMETSHHYVAKDMHEGIGSS
jgi:hypothetical protein